MAPIQDSEHAAVIARQRVDQLARLAGDQFEILPESTVEVEQGWVFFFNTVDFVRTRNPKTALAGNGPLLVTHDGQVHELPSAIPWRDALGSIKNR